MKKITSPGHDQTIKEEISAAEVKAQLAQVIDLLSSARAAITRTCNLYQDLAHEDLYEAEEIVDSIQRTQLLGEKFFFSRLTPTPLSSLSSAAT